MMDDAATLDRQSAYLERIRAMTPPHKPGATYPTAEQLVREDRDTR